MSAEVSLEKSNELHVDQNRGYYLPGDRSFTEGISILGRHELPKGKEVVFSVTPRDCYRVCGDELLTAPVVVNP